MAKKKIHDADKILKQIFTSHSLCAGSYQAWSAPYWTETLVPALTGLMGSWSKAVLSHISHLHVSWSNTYRLPLFLWFPPALLFHSSTIGGDSGGRFRYSWYSLSSSVNLLANISSKLGTASEVSVILKFCTVFNRFLWELKKKKYCLTR